MHDNDNSATIYGLLSAAVLTQAEWISYGEKLLYGAAVALISGFAYKAGGWIWEKFLAHRWRK